MKEVHNPLHPVAAIKVTYKNGTEKRFEFGSKAGCMSAMMHLWGDDVVGIERVEV